MSEIKSNHEVNLSDSPIKHLNSTPHQVTFSYCNAANSQKSIDKSLTNSFSTILENNKNISLLIKNLSREAIKEDRWGFFNKSAGYVAGVVSTLLVGILNFYINHYLFK